MARMFFWRSVVVGLFPLGCIVVAPVVTSVQPAGAVSAVTLHVSPGSTGTTCTVSDKCGSVSEAVNVATSGTYNGEDVIIQVAAGTYGASGSGDMSSIDASSLGSLAIVGAGASVTSVSSGGMSGSIVTILNGTVTITGLTITGNDGSAGAISIDGGTITIENDTLSNDRAAGGGGLSPTMAPGRSPSRMTR
jgi:hypothetical protein